MAGVTLADGLKVAVNVHHVAAPARCWRTWW